MKKSLKFIFFSILIGVATINTSCKKDDENMTILKGSGNHKINVLYGTTPVSGAKVFLYNSKSENILSKVYTDNSGNIDFGSLIEGNYSAAIEVYEPQYAKIEQQFQVLSGQSTESKVQVTDHQGNISFAVVLRNDYNSLVKEDFGMGIALIPVNEKYNKAKTLEEKFALKSAIKNIGTEGKVTFENQNAGNYAIYKVYNDKLVERIGDYQQYTVSRGENSFHKIGVNLNFEKAFSKASWGIKSAFRVNSSEYTDYPISNLMIIKDPRDYQGVYRIKMTLNNGAEITCKANYFNDYNGWTESYTYSRETDKRYSTEMPSYFQFKFNNDGELEVKVNYLTVFDQLQNSFYFYSYENHIITFQNNVQVNP